MGASIPAQCNVYATHDPVTSSQGSHMLSVDSVLKQPLYI